MVKNQNGVCSKIYRTMIGHYGGLHVKVPKQHYVEFKKAFPKQEFPRRDKVVNVADLYTIEGEERFHKAFPKSDGIVHEIYFSDRSKGIRRLEDLLDKCNYYSDPKYREKRE